MTDFLDQRDLSALLTEEVADLAARALLAGLLENEQWKAALRHTFDDEIYTAPEFRK